MSTSQQPRLRWGMVGGGDGAFIGAVHRMAGRLDDAYELVAAALSSDPERARSSGEALRLAPDRVYTDFRAMAEAEAMRADGIEVVSIVVPNHLHDAVAEAFIDAGIAVVCDKPLTTSLQRALALRDRAAARGVPFALTHNYSGYPMVRAARELVSEGRLGALRLVLVEYLQDWLVGPLEETGQRQAAWRTDPALAGPAGCLGDIGTHAAHVAEFVTGQTPRALSADLVTFVPGRRVDDHVQVQLRYAGEARGTLVASQVAVGEENGLRLRVYGEKGSLAWHQENPNLLWFSALGQGTRRLTRGTVESLDAQAATRLPAGHPEGFIEAFAQIYKDFAAVLLQRRLGGAQIPSLVPGLAEGVRSLAFVEAVLESHQRQGAWVTLD